MVDFHLVQPLLNEPVIAVHLATPEVQPEDWLGGRSPGLVLGLFQLKNNE